MKLRVLFRRDADCFCEGTQIIAVVVEAAGLAGFRDGAALIEQRFGQGDALCGDVFVDGIDIAKNPDMVRQKIGFLTSELKLEDFFTPNYLYDYFSALHKIEKTLSEQRKNYLFKKFGIEDFKEVKIGDLSTGMKQKVSLVISIVHDPEIIIFDEPTNGLDVITAKSVTDFLIELKKEDSSSFRCL